MSIFSETTQAQSSYSTFKMNHKKFLSMRAGILYPCFIQETVPGDTWSHSVQQMIKTLPLASPAMDEYNVYFHFFGIPNRLLDETWQQFITGGEEEAENDALPSMVENLNVANGSLADYLEYPSPTNALIPIPVTRMPFEAYNLVYNEYYRDQNLVQKIPLFKDQEGTLPYEAMTEESPDYFELKRRAWTQDYFTSNLPFAQKGDPVRIPLINATGQYLGVEFDETGFTLLKREDNGGTSPDGSGLSWPTGTNNMVTDGTGTRAAVDNSSNLRVPLEDLDVNAAYINDLRTAISVQQWMELAARGGSRYVELINTIFGVRSSDARLQRPVYLGGTLSPMLVSEIDQTSQTTDASPQGNLAGKMINMNSDFAYKQFFEEHGYILGLISIMPKAVYGGQGLQRKHTRMSRYDYFWPQFEGIGEQAIKKQEVYLSQDPQYNAETFGYGPRYSEYKFIPTMAHGLMRPGGNLDYWLTQRYWNEQNKPGLNKEFIECFPPLDIFADTDPTNDQFIACIWHNVTAKRKMSYFSPPGLNRI